MSRATGFRDVETASAEMDAENISSMLTPINTTDRTA